MQNVLLVIHLIVTIALIGMVLIQKSEGGALGIGGGGGGGGGMGGFMTGRETANFLTRTTGILAAIFMGLSLTIAVMSNTDTERSSILDSAPAQMETAPLEAPAVPTAPTAPLAQ
ncbi:MAG: preprotein translocase subunit SecG [Rhodospirillaceae bacterium]|nr:MAG: preprotein translocase subunit SecG [Rhodospirillaceae bacterium]